MNKDETLALWRQGREAWNAWAQSMLDRRAKMEKEGTWAVRRDARGDGRSQNEATQAWMAAAIADFKAHIFDTDAADFGRFLFPGTALFERAIFEADALFDDAKFRGYARFGEAMFSGDVRFEPAEFSGQARFGRATFSGNARFGGASFRAHAGFGEATFSYASFQGVTFSGYAAFDDANFREKAEFLQTRFKGYTSFAKATFRKLASFSAAQGEGAFTLEGARFNEVPDFTQAHFAEAPRLDNLQIRPEFLPPRGFWDRFPRVAPDPDRGAHYRALKRLAIDAHDHAREQEYFAGELTALRGHPDQPLPNPRNCFRRGADGTRMPLWPGGARYGFGLIYQLLSDFGRSMLRPLAWWALALFGFAYAYLDQHFARAAAMGRGYPGSVGAWLWGSVAQPMIERFPRLGELLPIPAAFPSPACLVGPGEPWSAALGLSIRKALPLAGVASAEKLNQIYACLYGIHGSEPAPGGELPARFVPVIPDAVDYLGMAQIILSLLLLFLFLLALRSQFRIH